MRSGRARGLQSTVSRNPWGLPFFIVTHRPEEEPEGGAFTFVSGMEEAVERALEAAGGKHVHVMGGADVIRQALDAGLVDELTVIIAPVVLGGGEAAVRGVLDLARPRERRRPAVAVRDVRRLSRQEVVRFARLGSHARVLSRVTRSSKDATTLHTRRKHDEVPAADPARRHAGSGTDAWERLSEDERNAVYAAHKGINETPGVSPGVHMQPPETATTMRVQDGKTLTTDGPFAAVDPAEQAIAALRCESLRSAVSHLPPHGRDVIERRVREWSVDEIACDLGIGRGSVRHLAQRGVAHLALLGAE